MDNRQSSIVNPKSVVVLGAARQGLALARYLAARGVRVTLSDAKPADQLDLSGLQDLVGLRYALGGHPPSLLDNCDVLYLSGGVPIDLPIVLEARRRGIPLSNDAQLFFEVCPAPIIGITGSAGKTTTTTLVGEMLRKEEGCRMKDEESDSSFILHPSSFVWVGGNIGNPLIADVERMRPLDKVVMELSSFQLDLMTRSPHIACVTNITPNHLDRHGTMEAYTAAKRHIVEFQSEDDWQVLNADDAATRALNNQARTVWFSLDHEPQGDGAWLDANGDLRVRVVSRGLDDRICHRRELLLMGDHNIANVLAASAVSVLAGASIDAVREVATTFKGVEHRLQLVAEINGARYYDDSIATAPERLVAALNCFEQPIILLCGGRDKHLPWAEAVALMRRRCKHIVLFGEMAGLVGAEIERQRRATDDGRRTSEDGALAESSVTVCKTLDEAVEVAASRAASGDVVLLSPGGTSYDAFRDFAERGDRFVWLVGEWARRSKAAAVAASVDGVRVG